MHSVEYTGYVEREGLGRIILAWIIPLLVIGVIWFFLFRRISGGSNVMAFGKSRAKLLAEDQPKVTFNDVAGVDEAEQELEEVIEFLKNPARFSRLGGKIPKGVLLFGPPGSGKTLLARAVAGEAGVPFFNMTGSGFVEMFVGVGASRVRDLFEQAKEKAPCIVFIDEIDAVGRQRGSSPISNEEREQTLNQLLSEMDGFESKKGVIIMAATNRPDVLDPALLRPGRFDRQILVDKPDLRGRVEILKVHTRDIPLADDVDLEVVARGTPGFSGADLANMINEAALLAARDRDKKSVHMNDIEEAIERVVAGLEKKNKLINDQEKEIVAYHESGHALVAELLPNADPVHKVSIIPRGFGALGYTMQRPLEDRYLLTKKEIEIRMAVLLGGRAAEEIIFSEISTGAQDDLQKVTDIARSMVREYGMSEKLGPLTFGEDQSRNLLGGRYNFEKDYSEDTAKVIDQEVQRIVYEQYDFVKELLSKNRDKLIKLSKALLEKETLEGEELKELLRD